MPCSSWQAYTPAAVLSPPPCSIMSHQYVPSSRFDLHIHAISLLLAKPSNRPIPPLLAKPLSKLTTLRHLLRHIRTLNGSNSSTLEQPNIPPIALYSTSPRSRVSTQTSKPTISPMCLLIVQDSCAYCRHRSEVLKLL